ncbi:MAG: M20 family metallopeptidase [Candidatus Omnitrophica bacterium]|nr:M20 family metallopeptidase [Candidatus Omnitrophota bacterium]MDD5552425.1 M20 family metallopeptidase [Candidatus Omnitrophota bacterium]
MVNKGRLLNFTRELIRINSENPPGNESMIARFVKKYCEKLGMETRIYEFKKKRLNVVSILKGKNRKRSLLITPHLDTVPAGRSWRFDPFAAKIKAGRLYGLGATDCKGNLAAGLEAINSIVEEGVSLDYDLIFAATADEECGSTLGLIPLLEKNLLRPDAALVLDSDDFDIVVTQKGLMHLKVKIQGKKAHGAYPWLGVNAIDRALEILVELKAHKFIYKKNKFLRPPTINIGTIKGGDKVNVVADWCEFEIDVRFLPGMRQTDILKYLRSVVSKHAAKYKIEIEGIQKPYWIDKEEPLVKRLIAAARKSKVIPRIKGSEGATVISFLQEKNIPAVATGFGVSSCAHIADEYVKIEDLYKGAVMLGEFLKKYK